METGYKVLRLWSPWLYPQNIKKAGMMDARWESSTRGRPPQATSEKEVSEEPLHDAMMQGSSTMGRLIHGASELADFAALMHSASGCIPYDIHSIHT